MSYVVNYDLPGYPRQHERGFDRVGDAEARANALAEQGVAAGITVSEGEEPAAEAPQTTTISVEVTVELPVVD